MKNKIIILVLVILVIGCGYYYMKPATASTNNPSSASTSTSTDTTDATNTKTFIIIVKNSKLVSGGGDLQVKQGDQVEFRIVDNRDEELHLHGYDLKVDMGANVASWLRFTADKTGRFPFELEHEGIELGNLIVQPN